MTRAVKGWYYLPLPVTSPADLNHTNYKGSTMTKEEIRDWLLKNCVDEKGDLNLRDLDFSDFDGNVDISFMSVKKTLLQRTNKLEVICYKRVILYTGTCFRVITRYMVS